MSNEEGGPWYKNPAIIVPIIVAIIGAIGVIFAASLGVFTGPELSTVQGIVTDDEGIPLAGAVVEIDGLSSTTDASGVYVIHDVLKGTKTITVRAPGAEVVKRALRIPKGDEIIIYDFILPPPPTITPTPTPTPTPTATTTTIIDTMDSTMVWNTYNDDQGSSINKKSIPGRTNKALEITYDLKEWGWVTFNKRIDPSILSEIEGIRFFYKGTGKPNTIELKLIYSDKDKYDGVDTTFGFSMNAATVKNDWTCVEVPYSRFNCWWSDKSCDDNPGLDLNNVRKIEFAISNKPEDGDVYGSGRVIIDDVQGIMSLSPTPPPSFVEISKPKEKDKVSWHYIVEGSSSATKDSGLSVYVLIWPIEHGPWGVQPTTTFSDGSWQSDAYFGRDPELYPEDIGTTLKVIAITTTQKLSGGQTFTELPDFVAKSKEIIVIRTEKAHE